MFPYIPLTVVLLLSAIATAGAQSIGTSVETLPDAPVETTSLLFDAGPAPTVNHGWPTATVHAPVPSFSSIHAASIHPHGTGRRTKKKHSTFVAAPAHGSKTGNHQHSLTAHFGSGSRRKSKHPHATELIVTKTLITTVYA